MKYYIGVDPGKSGGVVVLDWMGNFIRKHTIPKIGKDVDLKAFYKIFKSEYDSAALSGRKLHVCVESVHSIFGTSAKSNFSFGYIVGALDTIIVSLNLPYSKVQPKEWQKSVWLTSEIEREPSKTDKNGKVKQGKVLTKLTSLKAFKRLFPDVDLRGTERSKVPHDGLVDAILIAEYCRRQNL